MIRNSEKEVAKRIKEKTSGRFIYVSGYKIKESPIVVRCVKCGKTFERTYHHLTTAKQSCPICKAIKREKIKAEKARRKEIELQKKAERKAKKEAERERRRIERNKPHRCPVCGELTIRPKYCSDRCQAKARDSAKEVKRRRKINKAMVDKDITVQGLFKRDKGICHICGYECDYADYTMRGEVFIAGDWYPSIDHVIPLAKGGLHAWSNVKLAHRYCNSIKSDKITQR